MKKPSQKEIRSRIERAAYQAMRDNPETYPPGVLAGVSKKTRARLDREIAESLAARGNRSHSTKREMSNGLFAVEIDRDEFEGYGDLPTDARWREDLVKSAEDELGRGRTYRRPARARYAVIEWTGYRGEVGRLLDWMERTPGITRYAEIFA